MTKERIHPGDGDPRHGTSNGYSNLYCRCQPCRDAHAAYFREYKARLRAKGVPEGQHGTYNAYGNYGCRCDECRAANRRFSQGERLTDRRWAT